MTDVEDPASVDPRGGRSGSGYLIPFEEMAGPLPIEHPVVQEARLPIILRRHLHDSH